MSNNDEVLRSLVTKHIHNGGLSEYREEYLMAKGIELGINPDEARNIIHSALKVCAERNSRLQRFREALQKEAQNGFPLAKDIEDDLKDWSHAVLGLTQLEVEEIWSEATTRHSSHVSQEHTIESPQGLAIQYEINKYDIYPMHIKSLAASKCSRFFAVSMIQDSGLLGGFKVTQSKVRIYGFRNSDRLVQISEKSLTLPGNDTHSKSLALNSVPMETIYMALLIVMDLSFISGFTELRGLSGEAKNLMMYNLSGRPQVMISMPSAQGEYIL
jgi:hypothetical protein